MSLHAMGLVWKHSKATGSALVLMLAIADYADENLEAWPSIGRLAQRARISSRNVQKQLRRLVEMGELTPVRSGMKGVIVYRITCRQTPVASDTPVGNDTPVAFDAHNVTEHPVASDTQTVSRLVTDVSPANAVDTSVTRSNAVRGGRDIDEAFEAWWRIYPRRVAKTAAKKAYTRIIQKKEATHEDLERGAARFADQVAGSEARFIAHPATWLNSGRWLDEPDPAAGGRARNDQHSRIGEVLRGIALFDQLPRADVG